MPDRPAPPRFLADLLPTVPLWIRESRVPIYVTKTRHLLKVCEAHGHPISRRYASLLMNRKAPLGKELILLLMRASRRKLSAEVLLKLEPQGWPDHQWKTRHGNER